MLWGIFLLFCLLGTVQHFLYRPLGRPRSLAWLLPVSESPWEHCKLAFWPLGGALGTVTLLTGGTLPTFLSAWWAAAAHGLCTMLGIYYFYRAALGVPWRRTGRAPPKPLCSFWSPCGLGTPRELSWQEGSHSHALKPQTCPEWAPGP